jgi:hypothetical protein
MRATAVWPEKKVDVDLYNSATGVWSTAQLSVGRRNQDGSNCLAATSVGNVAIFAGGDVEGVLLWI